MSLTNRIFPTTTQGNNSRYLSFIRELISAWEPLLKLSVDMHLLPEQESQDKNYNFNGVAVSSDYINTLWQNRCTDYSEQLRRARDEFHQKREETLLSYSQEEIENFPLQICERGQNLTFPEKELIILLLALEIDTRFEKIYAFINDNVNRPFLTLQCASTLLNLLQDDTNTLQTLMHSSVIQKGLLQIGSPDQTNVHPTIAEKIYMQDDLYRYLLFGKEVAHELKGIASFTEKEYLAPLHEQSEEVHNLAAHLINNQHTLSGLTCIDMRGEALQQKAIEASALIRCMDKNCIEIQTSALIEDENSLRNKLIQLQYIAGITESTLFFRGFEALDKNNAAQATLLSILRQEDSVIFFDCTSERNAWYRSSARSYFRLNAGTVSYSELTNLWLQELLPLGFGLDFAKELAVRFKFSAEQINAICLRYQNALVVESPLTDDARKNLLRRECSDYTLTDLDSFAQKITPRYTWNDIVLNPEQKQHLQEIQNMVRYREQVFEQWGYGKKLFSTVGVKALFYGEPGTGKTMSVNVLGKELGLDIFRIDLSQIVSKYVGETEKNLEKVFNEAAKTDAILFFDEADAVFGKRTEVKDAHDRHANIETGYLLQKIEEYDGLVILATNLKSNLDKAFIRRFQFIVKFEMPGENERAILWRKMFPEQVPCSMDIDFDFLCKGINLSGAHIKNIALNAAFLAAHDSREIGMRHVVKSIRKEYVKLGRMITRDELGKYLEMN